MAPRVGLEPTTLRLTAECSAIELPRNVASAHYNSNQIYLPNNPEEKTSRTLPILTLSFIGFPTISFEIPRDMLLVSAVFVYGHLSPDEASIKDTSVKDKIEILLSKLSTFGIPSPNSEGPLTTAHASFVPTQNTPIRWSAI